jgi:hypothetical protein
MSNRLTKFKGDMPSIDHVYLYWDKDLEEWQIWFGDPDKTGDVELPMFKNGNFERLDVKFHRYKLVKDEQC